jgi:hypothetical protein
MSCNHKWNPRILESSRGVVSKEVWVCELCDAYGDLDWSAKDSQGFIPVKERALAKVIDLTEYRKAREIKKGEVSNG